MTSRKHSRTVAIFVEWLINSGSFSSKRDNLEIIWNMSTAKKHPVKILHCDDECKFVSSSFSQLRKHLVLKHNASWVDRKFDSVQDFQAWKDEEEDSTNMPFFMLGGKKKYATFVKQIFQCKGGKRRSSEDPFVGRLCPTVINATFHNDGTVEASYFKFHIGVHILDHSLRSLNTIVESLVHEGYVPDDGAYEVVYVTSNDETGNPEMLETVCEIQDTEEIVKTVDDAPSIEVNSEQQETEESEYIESQTSILEAFWKRMLRSGQTPTQVLIDVVKQEKIQNLLGSKRIMKSKVWGLVVDELSRRSAALPVSSKKDAIVKCHQKWRNLEYSYLQFIRNFESGERRKRKKPLYFDELTDVMAKKHKVDPILLIETFEATDSSSQETTKSVCNQNVESPAVVEVSNGNIETVTEVVIFPECKAALTNGTEKSPLKDSARENFWQSQVGNDQDATELLIDIISVDRYQTLLKNKTVLKTKVWEMIAEEMEQRGVPVPATSLKEAAQCCHQKWRNLEHMYTKYQQHRLNPGERRKKHPKYYDKLHVLLAKKYRVSLEDTHEAPPSSGITVEENSATDTVPETLESNIQTSSPNVPTEETEVRMPSKPKKQFTEFMSFLRTTHREDMEKSERRHNELKSLIEAQNVQLQIQNSLLEVQNKQRQDLIDIFKMWMTNSKSGNSDSDSSGCDEMASV